MERNKMVVVSDFVLSFMWVCSSVLLKTFVKKVISINHSHVVEIVKIGFSIVNMFYGFLAKVFRGGANNPLATLVFITLFFALVIGYIVGVKLLTDIIPEIGHGPRLNVEIYRGALTEGLLTFTIALITLGITATKIRRSFFMKTWISSIMKLILHKLGSNLTGGCMNLASVMGWAFARGDHISKEHILVYWLAPIKATLLAVWIFKFLVRHVKKR
ncbi:MIP aquaporin (TC 1.A.8) [Trifolium repens]|nr:MIP aquaporin (TC 1.A.8) [Trifolium repens]